MTALPWILLSAWYALGAGAAVLACFAILKHPAPISRVDIALLRLLILLILLGPFGLLIVLGSFAVTGWYKLRELL